MKARTNSPLVATAGVVEDARVAIIGTKDDDAAFTKDPTEADRSVEARAAMETARRASIFTVLNCLVAQDLLFVRDSIS